MAKRIITLVNQTGSPVGLKLYGGIEVPASGTIDVGGGTAPLVKINELQGSLELYNYVENDTLLIQIAGVTLSKIASLEFLDGTIISSISDVDTLTNAPQTGDNLIFNGTYWVPSSSGGAGSGGNNYAFMYKTSGQVLVAINTWENITFDDNAIIDGWSHTPGTAILTCNTSSIYACTAEFNVQRSTGGGGAQCSIRTLFNGVEILGSHQGMDISSNNTAFTVSRTFLVTATAGQDMVCQFAGNVANVNIAPAPAIGPPDTTISGTLLIRRMT